KSRTAHSARFAVRSPRSWWSSVLEPALSPRSRSRTHAARSSGSFASPPRNVALTKWSSSHIVVSGLVSARFGGGAGAAGGPAQAVRKGQYPFERERRKPAHAVRRYRPPRGRGAPAPRRARTGEGFPHL